MDHGQGPILGKYLIQDQRIGNIPLNERPPLYGPWMTVYQVIQNDGQVTQSCQGLAGVTANIAGASGNQNGFGQCKIPLYFRQSLRMVHEKLC